MKFFLFLWLIFSPMIGWGAIEWQTKENGIEINLLISSAHVSLEDRIALDFFCRYPDTLQLNVDQLIENVLWHGNLLQPIWKMAGPPSRSEATEAGKINLTLKLILEPINVGEYFLSLLNLDFQSKEHAAQSATLFTPIFSLTVTPPVDQTSTIENINAAPLQPLNPQYRVDLTMKNRELMTGPEALLREARRAVLIVRQHAFPWLESLLFILIGLSGWLTLLFIKQRKNLILAPQPIDSKEKAFQALFSLHSQKLPEKGSYKAFFTGLTTICRHYIEDTFHIDSSAKTTDEFLKDVHQRGLAPSAHQQLLTTILYQADSVKFANEKPSLETCEKMNELASELIKLPSNSSDTLLRRGI